MKGNRRRLGRARQVGRALLAAYLLVLFTPVSIAANLSLCVCEQCSRLESCPMLSCNCQVYDSPARQSAGCGCCAERSITAGSPGAGDECPSYLMPASLSAKLKVPLPQFDDDHLSVILSLADLQPHSNTTALLWQSAMVRGPTIEDLRTVRLLI